MWLNEEFGINPTMFYHNNNSYRTVFPNKILARYLIKFFDFMPGYKTYNVNEPKIIKESSLNIRKEFAKGAIIFDGSISKRKTLTFTSISQSFAESIRDILIKDEIKANIFRNKRGEYTVYTTIENKVDHLLKYLEKGTKKWDLLMWLNNNDFISKQITYHKDLKNTKKILEIIKEKATCDASFLMNLTKTSHTNIRQHLLILKSKNLIKLSRYPKKLNNIISQDTTVFLKDKIHNYIFNKILERFKNYEEFSTFLEISKGALSAWKVKKNRIPLKKLKEICDIIEANYDIALENIAETDREIAEII